MTDLTDPTPARQWRIKPLEWDDPHIAQFLTLAPGLIAEVKSLVWRHLTAVAVVVDWATVGIRFTADTDVYIVSGYDGDVYLTRDPRHTYETKRYDFCDSAQWETLARDIVRAVGLVPIDGVIGND